MSSCRALIINMDVEGTSTETGMHDQFQTDVYSLCGEELYDHQNAYLHYIYDRLDAECRSDGSLDQSHTNIVQLHYSKSAST